MPFAIGAFLVQAAAATINGTDADDVIRTAAAGGSLGGLPNATDDGDTIFGNGGTDLIEAGTGPDTLLGGAGADVIRSSAGNDTIIVRGGDAAAGESVDGGPDFDTLQILGAGFFDLTSWPITGIETVQVQAAQVVLTAGQLASFQRIAGSDSSLLLPTADVYRLDGRVAPLETPFDQIYGTAGNDTVFLDHTGGDRVLFDGRDGSDTAILPGSASDYVLSTNGTTVLAYRPAGVLNFELLSIEAIGFSGLPPVAQSDLIHATIGREGSLSATALLGNDSGAQLQLVLPSASVSVPTSQGGTLSVPGPDPVGSLTYRPPAELTTSFTDVATYRIRDEIGREADGQVTFVVDNRAPEAPDRTFRLTAGAIITVEDLLSQGSDPDGDALVFEALSPDLGSLGGNAGGAEPVLDPDSGQIVGFRVFPGDDPTTGGFIYSLRDDSGAIGNTDTGTITVTFFTAQPGQARPDTVRATIGGADYIPFEVLTANDDPGVRVTGIVGMVPLFGVPDLYVRFLSSAILEYREGSGRFTFLSFQFGPTLLTFDYTAEDETGSARTATVQVMADNRIPVAVARTFTVAPGGSVTVQLADLLASPGNGDPDGDPIRLEQLGSMDPQAGTLETFGAADPTNPNDLGRLVFTPAPGFAGTAATFYAINDVPDLGGTVRGSPLVRAALDFAVTASAPVLSLAAELVNNAEGTGPDGAALDGRFNFVLRRGGDTRAATEVHFQLLAGSATADDLSSVTGALPTGAGGLFGQYVTTFAPGEAEKTVTVLTARDATIEPDETFTLTLLAGVGYTLSTVEATTATGLIRNDDLAPVESPVLTYRVNEGAPPTLTFPEWPVGFRLERAVQLGAPDWTPFATNPPVTIPIEGAAGFFRLGQLP